MGSSLTGLVYTGSSMAGIGTDQVWVRANDGTQWSAWTLQNITTGTPTPVVTVSNATVLKGQTESLASVFTASDADPADAITQYQVWFSDPTSNHPALGTVTLNGTPIAVNQAVSVGSSLTGLVYTGSSMAGIGTDQVWVRANDGTQWSAWTLQNINAPGERAPVVAAGSTALNTGAVAAVSSLFVVSDADSDAITQYRLTIQNTDATTGSFFLNGTQEPVNQTLTFNATDFANLTFVAGAAHGPTLITAQAFDGTQWSQATNFVVTTTGPSLRLGTQLNDSLAGNAGSDSFAGGAGNDVLVGNGGYDYYGFDRTGGQATITNGIAGNATPTGELDFGATIATNQLWLMRAGNDLQIDIMGTSSHVTVAGWYAGAASQLQEIKTGDGSMLDGQLNSLVAAMSTFAATHPGFDPTAGANSQAPNDPTLQAALAAAWHH